MVWVLLDMLIIMLKILSLEEISCKVTLVLCEKEISFLFSVYLWLITNIGLCHTLLVGESIQAREPQQSRSLIAALNPLHSLSTQERPITPLILMGFCCCSDLDCSIDFVQVGWIQIVHHYEYVRYSLKRKKKKMNTLDNSLLDFGILIVGLIGFFFFFLWVFRRN